MELTEITYDGQPPIDAYGPGFFRVQGAVHEGPLALLPGGVIDWHGLDDWDAILAAHADFDVIFIGMGAQIAALPLALKNKLDAAGLPYEPMATPTACRSYNVLLSEKRRVAIVALPV